ncbi:hypothetical protein BBP40_009576 [Aspergillus hancockii]|nr:hypothetical protein BBP40_009576 [Aspergillus hancockii]
MDSAAAAKDFRRFIQELDDKGELLTVTKEVAPDLESAAIVQKVCETGERAPLFTNPKGREGNGLIRVLSTSIEISKRPGMELCRIAKYLGLLSQSLQSHVENSTQGPVKDHIIRGDDIDLTQMPVPLLHEQDEGKFIGTLGMHVVQSPDGTWTNWSISRGMVHGKRELVGLVIPKQDIGTIWNLWKEKGEDMPWAVCVAVPPAAIVGGGMPIPSGPTSLSSLVP